MRRPEFIAAVGATAWPLVVGAQQPALPVIGYLNTNQPDTMTLGVAAFLEGIKEGGYVDGRNVAIEYRWADGHLDRLPALVADLVRRQVKVLVTSGVDATLAAKSATTTIPIVFASGADPVGAGFVSSLSRPRGNVTGVSNFATGLGAKRLELLHKLVPKVASIGILVDPRTASSEIQKIELQEAASALGLTLTFLNATNDQEIDAAFASIVRQRIGALCSLTPDSLMLAASSW
jgi:putative tryptophan/tyrosine transport system substrate-binding protein